MAWALLDTCLAYCKARVKEIRVHVDHDKLKARTLYAKYGFQTIEVLDKETYMTLALAWTCNL